jgi:hypothetical protein
MEKKMITQTLSPTTQTVKIPLPIAHSLTRETRRLIGHDSQYVPVLVTYPENQLILSAGFSLAEMEMDSGYKLKLLIDFIRQMNTENHSGRYIPCSHKIVEQIAYLSYWKYFTLESRLEMAGKNLVATARFPREPELTCVLDVFPSCDNPSSDQARPLEDLQKWFDFLCQVVREYAQIWQIHLIVARSILTRLRTSSDRPDVFVEVLDSEEKACL